MSTSHPDLGKNFATGLAGLLVMALLIWLCIALYGQQFRSSVPITVHADRAGLLMDPGADVKMRGVAIGRVSAVDVDGNGADLRLDIDPAYVGTIPLSSSVSIVPPTVFGAKFVDIEPGTNGPMASAGSSFSGARVTVEINQTFDAAVAAMHRLAPADLSVALSSTADLLRGRGATLNHTIRSTALLATILLDEIPKLGTTADSLHRVALAYDPAVDDTAMTLANAATILDDLKVHSSDLDATLQTIIPFGYDTAELLAAVAPSLEGLAQTSVPVTALLARYAPEYPCLLRGIQINDRLLSAVMGGPEFGGSHRNAHVTFQVERGLPAYQYPNDLPKIGANTGPNCDGLPHVHGLVPHYKYDTGADPYPQNYDHPSLGNVPLSEILFGLPGSGGTK